MQFVFSIFVISLVSLFVFGLINPSKALWWYNGERNRKKVLLYYGVGYLAFMFIFSRFLPDVKPEKEQPIKVEANNDKIDTLFNVMSIAGKTEKEVGKILGKPTQTTTVNPSKTPCPCKKNTYNQKEYEVVYINGKADWITFVPYSYDKIEIKNTMITSLGLPQSFANFYNRESVAKWNNIAGIKSISFFNDGQGKLDYVYIKTLTD